MILDVGKGWDVEFGVVFFLESESSVFFFRLNIFIWSLNILKGVKIRLKVVMNSRIYIEFCFMFKKMY